MLPGSGPWAHPQSECCFCKPQGQGILQVSDCLAQVPLPTGEVGAGCMSPEGREWQGSGRLTRVLEPACKNATSSVKKAVQWLQSLIQCRIPPPIWYCSRRRIDKLDNPSPNDDSKNPGEWRLEVSCVSQWTSEGLPHLGLAFQNYPKRLSKPPEQALHWDLGWLPIPGDWDIWQAG